MTISNNNLQIPLLTPVDVQTDGSVLAPPLQSENPTVNGRMATESDGDFWSMLSRQFSQITENNDPEVIENKGLLELFNAFEEDLEGSLPHSEIPAEWMQYLKSHFMQDGMQNDESMSNAEVFESVDLPVMGAAPQSIDMKTDASIDKPDGEELPLIRQAVSTSIDPRLTVAPQASTINEPSVVVSPNRPEIAVSPVVKPVATEATKPAQADGSVDIEGDLALRFSENTNDKAQPRQLLQELAAAGQKTMEQVVSNGTTSQPFTAAAPQSLLQGSLNQTTLLPPALQTLSLSPAVPASQWGEAIGERVSFLINHKLNNAEIRLDPPHLGKLDIQIQVKEDSAVVVIQTQHAQTRDVIDNASHRLREFLQEAGYNSVDVNVSHRDQSMAQDDSSQQDGGQVAGGDDSEASTAGADAADLHQAELLWAEPGRVDYFA